MPEKRKFLQLTANEHSKLKGGLADLPLEVINQSLRYTNIDFYRSKKLLRVLDKAGISENEYINRIRGIQEAGVIRKIKKLTKEGTPTKQLNRLIRGLEKRLTNDVTEYYVSKSGITAIITAHSDNSITIERQGHIYSSLSPSASNGIGTLFDMVVAKHAERYRDIELDDDITEY